MNEQLSVLANPERTACNIVVSNGRDNPTGSAGDYRLLAPLGNCLLTISAVGDDDGDEAKQAIDCFQLLLRRLPTNDDHGLLLSATR